MKRTLATIGFMLFMIALGAICSGITYFTATFLHYRLPSILVTIIWMFFPLMFFILSIPIVSRHLVVGKRKPPAHH
jgi:hypothetical protein